MLTEARIAALNILYSAENFQMPAAYYKCKNRERKKQFEGHGEPTALNRTILELKRVIASDPPVQ